MLSFVFDECIAEELADAVRRHNLFGSGWPIDFVCVGDGIGPPKGTLDPELLQWAEREDRLIVTRDANTMPGHLTHHLDAGHHSPGVLGVRHRQPIPAIVESLELIAHAAVPVEFPDDYRFIPF